MKLSDELKDARRKIEAAMNEANRVADARCIGAGRSYGVEARLKAAREGKIPHSGDVQPPKSA